MIQGSQMWRSNFFMQCGGNSDNSLIIIQESTLQTIHTYIHEVTKKKKKVSWLKQHRLFCKMLKDLQSIRNVILLYLVDIKWLYWPRTSFCVCAHLWQFLHLKFHVTISLLWSNKSSLILCIIPKTLVKYFQHKTKSQTYWKQSHLLACPWIYLNN